MSDFSVIKPSGKLLYWYEMAKYVAPYATVGSLLLSGFSYSSEVRQEHRLDQIAKQLRELKSLVINMERRIIDKLNDQVLKERSSEVLSYREFLQEQTIIQDTVALNLELSNMRTTKHKVLAYVNDVDTPLDYKASYCGLLMSLVSMRIAAFECLDLELAKVNELALDEINELLSYEDVIKATLREVGSKRVHSYEEERLLVDELGPVWGTIFSVMIDDRKLALGSFTPGSNSVSDERRMARKKVEELRERHASGAFDPFMESLAKFSMVKTELIEK